VGPKRKLAIFNFDSNTNAIAGTRSGTLTFAALMMNVSYIVDWLKKLGRVADSCQGADYSKSLAGAAPTRSTHDARRPARAGRASPNRDLFRSAQSGSALHHADQVQAGEWLANQGDAIGHFGMSRGHDDVQGRSLPLRLLYQFQAIHFRHLNVCNKQVDARVDSRHGVPRSRMSRC
jgi:hypothetical protein